MADRNWRKRKDVTRWKQTGMTLIELLIVVAIVGILVAVAYPSYQDHIARAKRAEAKGILLETAQFMERYYTSNGRYDQDPAAVAVALPYAQSPKTGTKNYDITPDFTACALGQCYTLSAAPTGSMAGDACGTLTLTHTGTQGPSADCWQH